MNCVYAVTYFQVDSFFRCDQSAGKHVKGILHLARCLPPASPAWEREEAQAWK